MGRTMQSAVASIAKKLLADLRSSACRTTLEGPAAASAHDFLAARRALEPAAAISAPPESVTDDARENKSVTTPVARISWSLRGNKSVSGATSHPIHACRPSQNTGRARKQNPGVRCHSTWHGQPAQQKGPIISRLDPALQQQWDHAANAHLGPIDITPKNGRKVWWTCDQCPDGHLHRWEATVLNRSNGNGCPQCSGHKVCKHNSLATKAPAVAAQWDYDANHSTPANVVAQSSHPVGWRCDVCNHKWSTSPNHRVCKNKTGCPECYDKSRGNKKVKHPTFAECHDPHSKAVLAEWDHKRNQLQGYFPYNTTLRSNKQIFWLCHKCPAGQQHSWSAKPNYRNSRSKTGCPACAGKAACKCNSLQALYPAIAEEWDQSKNPSQPSDHTASSNFVAWWSTPQGPSWQQSISQRTSQETRRGVRLKHTQQRRHPARDR